MCDATNPWVLGVFFWMLGAQGLDPWLASKRFGSLSWYTWKWLCFTEASSNRWGNPKKKLLPEFQWYFWLVPGEVWLNRALHFAVFAVECGP